MEPDLNDSAVIGQCLRAAAEGPFFDDWEFHTLFGLDREEVRRIAESWPRWGDIAQQELAVNNTLVNLLSYPHGRWDGSSWHSYITAPAADVADVFERWRAGRGAQH